MHAIPVFSNFRRCLRHTQRPHWPFDVDFCLWNSDFFYRKRKLHQKNYYAHLSKMFSIFANWHGNAFNQKHTKNVFLRVFKVCKLAKLECTRKVEGRNFSFPIHLCPFEIELFDFVNVKNWMDGTSDLLWVTKLAYFGSRSGLKNFSKVEWVRNIKTFFKNQTSKFW